MNEQVDSHLNVNKNHYPTKDEVVRKADKLYEFIAKLGPWIATGKYFDEMKQVMNDWHNFKKSIE